MNKIIILLILFLLPFFITSLFNYPAIDDFWSANAIHDYGRIGAVNHFYLTVSARFFSNFLMSLLNTLPDGNIWIFKLWPIIIIILLIGSFKFFYASLFAGVATTKELILASTVFVALHIANMRSLFEGLYWMSSTICYQVAICLFLVGIGSVIRSIRLPSRICSFIAITCALLLSGSAEIIVPVFIIVLLAILFISVKEKYALSLTLSCIVVAVGSLVFVAFSKGNLARVRNDAITYNQNIFYALFYSMRAVVYYSIFWLITPINIASVFLVLPALKKLSDQISSPIPRSYYKPAVLIPLCFLTCTIIYLPLNYFESTLPFPRITTITFCVATHLALVLILLALKNSPWLNCFVSYLLSIKNYPLYTWIFFSISAFTSNNFLAVTKDLFQGNSYNYNIEANNRFRILKNAKSDTCYVPLYVHWPSFVQSSKVDKSNPFIHMDKYFGKTILYEKSKN